MVERVVEQGRELQSEVALHDDVLVEPKVRHPRAGALQAALLGVAKLARGGNGVRRLIEERFARSASVGIADLIRPPCAAEEVAADRRLRFWSPWAARRGSGQRLL